MDETAPCAGAAVQPDRKRGQAAHCLRADSVPAAQAGAAGCTGDGEFAFVPGENFGVVV